MKLTTKIEKDLFNVYNSNLFAQAIDEVEKEIAVYYRVSGSSQSIKLQKDKAESWASENGYSWGNDIEVFNEKALSANQVEMEHRPELMRLLNSIKSGRIKVVVVFARDRLARNFYEYMIITQIFIQYNVKVIFIGGTAPFSYNYLTEGIYGIQIQQEGTNIASRVHAVQKLYPNQKFGFINQKDKREYVIDDRHHYNILTFFQEVSSAKTFEELCELLKSFEKENRRKSVENCWRLLRTPFYSGHYYKDGNYYRLEYIKEPIISLELFKKVQKVMDLFETDFIKALGICEQEAYYHPTCGICHEKMMHKKEKIGESALYYCKSHKQNSITVKELNSEIVILMTKLAKNLSKDKIEKLAVYSTNRALSSLRRKKVQLDEMMKRERQNFYLRNGATNSTKFLERKNEIEREQKFVQGQINDLGDTKTFFKDIEKMVKQRLFYKIQTEEIYLLLSLLMEDIQIIQQSIIFRVYFTELLKGDLNGQ